MGRTHPKCAIYMLINKVNNKKYIGETSNIVNRMSQYKNTKNNFNESDEHVRSIDREILRYGFNTFSVVLLEDEDINKDVTNKNLRKILESFYINKYNTADPNIGYNMTSEVHIIPEKNNKHKIRKKRIGVPCSEETKLLKSKAIFVYDIDTREVSHYDGCKIFGDILGKDRAIIARCSLNGKKTSHYYVFPEDQKLRYKNANKIIQGKQNVIDRRDDLNKKASKSLNSYIEALIMVNEYCKAHSEYEEIDLSFIYQRTRYFHLTKT